MSGAGVQADSSVYIDSIAEKEEHCPVRVKALSHVGNLSYGPMSLGTSATRGRRAEQWGETLWGKNLGRGCSYMLGLPSRKEDMSSVESSSRGESKKAENSRLSVTRL